MLNCIRWRHYGVKLRLARLFLYKDAVLWDISGIEKRWRMKTSDLFLVLMYEISERAQPYKM